jgi:hypothetical protein
MLITKLMKMNMIMIFEDINDVNNEKYKGNDEEDHEDKDDGDEAKLVVLTHRNEKIIIMTMIIYHTN